MFVLSISVQMSKKTFEIINKRGRGGGPNKHWGVGKKFKN